MSRLTGWDRWNTLIAVGLVAFSCWLTLVIISSAIGENTDVGDDALLIGAAGGFITLLLQQVRHGVQIKATQDKVDQVYEHVNNVEEQEAIPGAEDEPERPTLGSLLRRIDGKVDALAARLDAMDHPQPVPPAGTSVPTARPSTRRRKQ